MALPERCHSVDTNSEMNVCVPVALLFVIESCVIGENNFMKGILSALTGPIDNKLTELKHMSGDEDTQENVMMELGMELLLKEPVIKSADRQMLADGGPKAVRFYLDLLKKITIAEEEFHIKI